MVRTEDPVQSFWKRAMQVRSFSFQAVPGDHSKTGWQGIGEGTVEVISQNPEHCRFMEKGQFSSAGGGVVDFRNQYIWQSRENGIDVFHQRFRDPRFLVHLVAKAEDDVITSVEPHLCGKDAYWLEVRLKDAGFSAIWDIQGPRKDERLYYEYGTS